MQVLELMKTHVVKIAPDASLSEAIDLMDLYQATGLPVVDAEGRLCGVLSDGDIFRALKFRSLDSAAGTDPVALQSALRSLASVGEQSVCQYMAQPAVSVVENTPILEAAHLLIRHNLKRLPVTSVEGQVVGMLNRIDVCQAIFEGIL